MLNRRAFLASGAAFGASVLVGGPLADPAAGAARRLALRRTPVETPLQAKIAVRVFPTYRRAVYGNHDAVLHRLGQLGIRRISHRLTPGFSQDALVFTQRAFTEHGIKSWFTVGLPNVVLSAAEWDDVEETLRGPLAGMVELVSGYNEPNNDGVTDWAARSVAHNRELYRRFSGLIPQVGTPQLWSGNLTRHDSDVKALKSAGLAGSFNTIAWHLYPRGGVGTSLIDRFEQVYFGAFGRHPVVCTEAGYSTPDPAVYSGGAKIVTELEQATLLPQLIDAYATRGYGLSYFELLDDPDPTGGNREAHLGLWRCPALEPATWTPKPALAALRDKIAAA